MCLPIYSSLFFVIFGFFTGMEARYSKFPGGGGGFYNLGEVAGERWDFKVVRPPQFIHRCVGMGRETGFEPKGEGFCELGFGFFQRGLGNGGGWGGGMGWGWGGERWEGGFGALLLG